MFYGEILRMNIFKINKLLNLILVVVIINFLVAIFEEMLTVIVGETEISSKTLGDLIKKYEGKDKELTNTSHYYNVLKSGKEPKIISIGDSIILIIS